MIIYFSCYLQLLNLLEVIIDNARSKSNSSDKLPSSTSEPSSGQQSSALEANASADPGVTPSGINDSTIADNSSKSKTSGHLEESETQRVLSCLPQEELRLLCSLLAQEGYDFGLMVADCTNSVNMLT